ncbi:ribbon-helix-helix domain-containing protein [Arenibaculum sp.]|uniref:ribbon-helix-helix domain-containing protein n=1 Tax=Arenibaculum sp. TaxID=2865862 RepID=UPI002E142672|nr:ribbon-helix-helix domain-containing protein [Arenibaculum sp.]
MTDPAREDGVRMPRSANPQSQVTRTVVVRGHRTSIRMESVFWHLIESISTTEGLGVDDLLSEIDARRGQLTLTAAVRVFAVTYFKDAPPPR